MNAWGDLPNANYIDWAFSSLEFNSHVWSDVGYQWSDAYRTNWSNDSLSAWKKIWSLNRSKIWNEVQQKTFASSLSEKIWSVYRPTILGLVAYDDCAYLINEHPEEVELMARLGCTRSILMLPTSIVYHRKNNACNKIHLHSA